MKQKLKDNLQLIIALGAVVGLVTGSITYFAKASDLRQVEYRLDQKIKDDKAYYLKRQLWALYGKHKTENCNQMPQPDAQICRDLKHELEQLTGQRS
jgi:hypothetical protein